jgi:hypothetical protein
MHLCSVLLVLEENWYLAEDKGVEDEGVEQGIIILVQNMDVHSQKEEELQKKRPATVINSL